MTDVKTILKQVKKISKPQFKFMLDFFIALSAFWGRATMKNLSRFGAGSTRRIARWSRKSFDFVEFNRLALEHAGVFKNTVVAAIDCSFVKKSGQSTWGLAKFYNGSASRAERGLEASALAFLDVDEKTAYALDVQQTPAKLPEGQTRVDFYVSQVTALAEVIKRDTRYVVADGFYAKQKVADGFTSVGLHLISKLRKDANLRYLYNAPVRSGPGRPKTYDGKVDFANLSRMEQLEASKEGEKWFTALVNHKGLKRNLRIVVIVRKNKGKESYRILFSTDTEINPSLIVEWYAARFQIEFIFRDGKEFTGFGEAQVRDEKGLSFFLNTSLSSLNLLRLEDRKLKGSGPRVISIDNWKRRKHNEMLLTRISEELGFSLKRIKSHPNYQKVCNFGLKAA